MASATCNAYRLIVRVLHDFKTLRLHKYVLVFTVKSDLMNSRIFDKSKRNQGYIEERPRTYDLFAV